MPHQTSFAERLARIETRARQGDNHGFVEPGAHDDRDDDDLGYTDQGFGRGIARVVVGGVAMLSVTAIAFVAGLWLLLPQDDAMALGIVARDAVLDHLSFVQASPAAE